jgi:hypothetical protein
LLTFSSLWQFNGMLLAGVIFRQQLWLVSAQSISFWDERRLPDHGDGPDGWLVGESGRVAEPGIPVREALVAQK